MKWRMIETNSPGEQLVWPLGMKMAFRMPAHIKRADWPTRIAWGKAFIGRAQALAFIHGFTTWGQFSEAQWNDCAAYANFKEGDK